MPSFLNNGATIILVSLLVLAIAYRFYSAFLAAKVLTLNAAAATPAHTLSDGQNYHPTNKWVLFGHHFAAISGAGPLIGPVLAAQFGYLPGLLWILIGVCLAGAVQDFIILTLSIRRNGKSLAQIAFSEIGPASGTAATIGILFVIVIALAGLGKVVTKALGGEKVMYPQATQFVATDAGPMISQGNAGGDFLYKIPVGTSVVYPGGGTTEVTTPFTLIAEVHAGDPIDIEDTKLVPGEKLTVRFGESVTADTPEKTVYPGSTVFLATGKNLIQLHGMTDNVYRYTIPAGTRIIQDRKITLVEKPFDLTARATDIGTPADRSKMTAPFGAVATNDSTKIAYPVETQFIAPAGKPIQMLPVANNLYRYVIPAGTKIGPGPKDAVATDDQFTLTIAPVDIQATQTRGTKLVVAKDMDAFQKIDGSTWGTFTIFLTIPIALLIGIYLYRIRKGRVLEASIIGGLMIIGAVYLGGQMAADEAWLAGFKEYFNLTAYQVGYSMAIYGFIASVLPVWMLLCPRDYLSSFLKIGTIILLVVGVVVAHPQMQAPAFNTIFSGGGPVVPGAVFPFMFITIMCGAVSGFHALVASGTTPKMINKETDARMIGYGAMLIEGLVGIVALIAASALPVQDYYNINTPPAKLPQYAASIREISAGDRAARIDDAPDSRPPQVAAKSGLPDVGENVEGRTGGAVTLAMGMAFILDGAVKNVIGSPAKPPLWLGDMFKYWYHFAIMFEALFILTTIDTGTRVGRFLLQESLGKWVHPKLGKTDFWPSAVLATAVISVAWWYFLSANAFDAIWVMFGIANQMLAVIALAVATAALARGGKKRYLAVTLVPMIFVAITTGYAAVLNLIGYVGKMGKTAEGENPANPYISAACVIVILICTGIVVVGAVMETGSARKQSPCPWGEARRELKVDRKP